jgi:hypothetical protein
MKFYTVTRTHKATLGKSTETFRATSAKDAVAQSRKRFPNDVNHDAEAWPTTPAAAKPIRFTLEGTPVYEGFAHGSKWNGFDNVYVTPEVRDEIVADLRAMAPADATPVELADYISGIDELEPYVRDGKTYYDLSGGFVSTIVDDEPLLQDECDVLGLDGRDGTGEYTYGMLSSDQLAALRAAR